jgi:phosphoribosylformylglycinamidine synthase
MAEACRAFETPVTGGNVSLYNETEGAPIYPTPTIGMVGIVEDVERVCRHAFRGEGDRILLLGANRDELGGSEYLYVMHGLVAGEPPQVDLLAERALQHALLAMIGEGLLASAHDCSEGGLACALAESAIGDGLRPLGVEVTLGDDVPAVSLFFGETQGRVVVSCAPASAAAVARVARSHDVPCAEIGRVGAPEGRFHIRAGSSSLDCGVRELSDAWFGALPSLMDAPAAATLDPTAS